MKRTSLNFLVDAIALAAFVLLAATGVLVRYVLPAGSGHFSTIWGLNRHGWGTLHFWIAVILLGTLALHLFLHWRWVVSFVKGRPTEGSGVRAGLAVVGLVALIAMAVSPFLSSVEQKEGALQELRKTGAEASGQLEIRGFMTLGEVEELSGVPAQEILRALHLPQDLPAQERLGKLSRTYGFDMEDVRRILQDRHP